MLTLIRVGLSNVKRHPWQALFLILGVTLGVAVIVAVDIANQSASRSFSLSLKSISGKATHRIVGGKWGVDEKVYVNLKTKLGIHRSAPVITDYVKVKDWEQHSLQILGIDIFAELPFRDYLNRGQLGSYDFVSFSQKSGSAIIAKDLAKEHGIKKGDKLRIQYQAKDIEITIVSFIDTSDPLTKKAMTGIIIVDIATAQEILNHYKRLSHIDLQISDKEVQHIKAYLPKNTRIIDMKQRSKKTQQITASFQFNLMALSLLAILIGAFIIYDTVTFSVVRRRKILGILRSLGATKNEIFLMIVGETLVMSLIGLVFGFMLGAALGKAAVFMVTQTINDIYFTLTVTDFTITYTTIYKSFIGVIIAIVAAIFPAIEASKIPPISVLRRSHLDTKFITLIPRFITYGILLVIIGIGTLFVPSNSLFLGFASILFFVLGCTFFTPVFVYTFMSLLRKLTTVFSDVTLKMAPRNIQRNISRTSIAIAALAISIASLIAINIMIGSFRTTFIKWLDQVFTADILIAGKNKGIARAEPFATNIIAKILTIDGVKDISTSRTTKTTAEDGNIININAVTRNISNKDVFLWKDNSSDKQWNNIDKKVIVVSEPFAYRYNIKPHQKHRISLFTDAGLQQFTITGVYSDYSSDQGKVIMSDTVYRHYWKDKQITAIAVFLTSPANKEKIIQQLKQSIPKNLQVNANSELREISLKIFDRTFTITFAMQILVCVVAFIAIVSTLMALQLERKKEISILRANGMTPRQLGKLIFYETGIMGFTAGFFAIPLGIIIAIALIYVINIRSFGWTIELFVYPHYFIQGLSIAIVAALVAGLYPLSIFVRTNIAKALREE
ncbi:FtsX-like permease family protein [Candidatus Uabimicrobium sp. HlEnr_7]|uniref:FtsX-like permease family protein n=1 Tax=Candidatus Uabimicrobium helgolandensis TaxID=3095367 RepID=UPI003556D409